MPDILDIKTISDVASQAAGGADIELVFIFGSCARGGTRPQSDIDICLEASPILSLFNAGAFASAVEAMMGKMVDIVSERVLFSHVR